MKKVQGAFRVTTCSSFGPTLETESLPIVGEDRGRDRYRARAWRAIFITLALFWGGIVWLIAGAG
jgi:hypothetical protein